MSIGNDEFPRDGFFFGLRFLDKDKGVEILKGERRGKSGGEQIFY